MDYKMETDIEDKYIMREDIIVGHSKPVKEEETKKIFSKKRSMCKIFSTKVMNKEIKDIKGTGFLLYIDNKDIPFHTCLLTNHHVLDVKINKVINIEYQNKDKILEIKEKRRVFTDEKLDYTCIEILKEDNINQYFEINKNINNINYFTNHDIFVLQYPNGEELSYSVGEIIKIKDNYIFHTASTTFGSSGSPILSRNDNLSVIGLHFGAYKKKFNLSTTINAIINDIIKKCNNNIIEAQPFIKEEDINIIIAEIVIKEEDINKKIRNINSYEQYIREEKIRIGERYVNYNDKYENEKEIKDNCKIEINGKTFPFAYYFTFPQKGKFIIKYSFSKNLTNTNHMFYNCNNLTNINLLNFKTQNINDMSWMFSGCASLTNINLSDVNTINVTDMSYMFNGCISLTSINLSNINTENVTDMSYMFNGCKFLTNINLLNSNTKNATDMSFMFNECDSLKKESIITRDKNIIDNFKVFPNKFKLRRSNNLGAPKYKYLLNEFYNNNNINNNLGFRRLNTFNYK